MGESVAHLTHKSLTGIDIAIIAVYFVVIFGIGFYFARKGRSSTDYFLASRDVGWFAIGASLFVSNISTEHFIGLAGSGASSGLSACNPPNRRSRRWNEASASFRSSPPKSGHIRSVKCSSA